MTYAFAQHRGSFLSDAPKRKIDPDAFDAALQYASQENVPASHSYTPSFKRQGVTVTKTPKNTSRPNLRQTTLTFSKQQPSLSQTLPGSSFEHKQDLQKPSSQQMPTQHSVPRVLELSFDNTLTTLTVTECLSVKIEGGNRALLPSPDKRSPLLLTYVVCYSLVLHKHTSDPTM